MCLWCEAAEIWKGMVITVKDRKFWQGFLTGGLSVLACLLAVCIILTASGKLDLGMAIQAQSGCIMNKELKGKMQQIQAYVDKYYW